MMAVMAHTPFHFGIPPHENRVDSFDDAIERISYPIRQPNQQSMKQLFLSSFRNEDTSEDLPDEKEEIRPKRYDIICGRDKLSHAHVGNKRFRIVIEANRERYQTAPSRDDKTRITCEIVNMIKSCRPGGRFLKLNTDTKTWSDVGDEYAREKVSHALRSAKDPSRKKVRKKRKAVPKNHTEEENNVFSSLLEEQQRIFRSLVQREEEREGRPSKRQRSDDSLSSGD